MGPPPDRWKRKPQRTDRNSTYQPFPDPEEEKNMSTKTARIFAVFASFCALSAVSSGAAAKPKIGEGGVLATIPAEVHHGAGLAGLNSGFPEGVVVVEDRVYVSGPATFGTAGKGPSVVTVLHRDNGHVITQIPIEGEDTALEHAISGITTDGHDVYVISTQLGVIRLELHGHHHYTQAVYAPPLPDLPACSASPAPCSPTAIDMPPLPNELTFDDDGNLYVTDSLQATVFRVAPGGGAPAVWFQSPVLAGNLGAPLPFGANGVKVSPDRDYLYVVETFDPTDASKGEVYRIPLVDAPSAGSLQLVHTFEGGVVPDSLVFGRSGQIYVSLAGANQIAVLDNNGQETSRLSGPTGSAIPFDGPATMAFDNERKSLLVANHAIFGDPDDFAVLRVYVGEKGDPLPDLDPCH